MVKNLVIAASLAIVLNILFFNWVFHDDVINHGQDVEYIKAGIQHLDIKIENDDVLLNVKLSKPLTCNELFDIMDKNDLPLRGKMYTPVCTHIDTSSAVITYKEKKSE